MGEPLPIETHDSGVTMPLTDVQQARCTELAERLTKARQQAFAEASIVGQLLKLAQDLLPGLIKR